MLANLRVATKDQYCFIEAQVEGTAQEVVEAYGELYQTYHSRSGGVSDKELHGFLDEMLSTGHITNGQELIDKMSEPQKWLVNEVKKSIKRCTYKGKKELT